MVVVSVIVAAGCPCGRCDSSGGSSGGMVKVSVGVAVAIVAETAAATSAAVSRTGLPCVVIGMVLEVAE